MSSGEGPRNPVTIREVLARKTKGPPLIMVSAYDALFARLADEGGTDIMLVGDSLGNVIAGFDSTIPVTLDQMIYHGAAVRRGTKRALVVVDLPFLTYHASAEEALRNAGRVMQETLAQAVKVEGATPRICGAVRLMVDSGIPVMGHIGFTPQSVHALGGFRVQGRAADDVERLVDEARRLEEAGAFSIVLELMPAAAAKAITESVGVPTIGIGAGANCDGQVLVLLDMLGLNDTFAPRFLKHYARMAETVRGAVREFADDVHEGRYPDDAHSF